MGKQGIRVDARRTVREALGGIRRERIERDRRIAKLAVELVSAVARRDEAVAAADYAAAASLQALLAEELTLADVGDLCGGQIGVKELSRLTRLPSKSPAVVSQKAASA